MDDIPGGVSVKREFRFLFVLFFCRGFEVLYEIIIIVISFLLQNTSVASLMSMLKCFNANVFYQL